MAYLESSSGANFSSSQTITATADSTNVFDVTGAGAGNSPAMTGANGVNTALGYDIGAGEGVATPIVLVTFGTCTTVTGQLSITLSAAPDNGSYSAGSYTVLYKGANLTGATQLFAGARYIIPVPPIIPGESLPRFYKLTYTVETGSISVLVSASLVLNPGTIRDATLYGSNYPSGL